MGDQDRKVLQFDIAKLGPGTIWGIMESKEDYNVQDLLVFTCHILVIQYNEGLGKYWIK